MNKGFGRIPTDIMKMNINKNTKLVLMCLCCYAGKRNYSFPSITTICKDLKLGRTTVMNSLKEAVELNLIKIEKLYPNDPFKKNNKYILLFIDTVENPERSTSDSPNVGLPEVPLRSPESELSKSQCRTKNNNININKHKKNKFSDSKESQKLKKYIREHFKIESPEFFKTKTDFQRENKAIKRLVDDIHSRYTEESEQIIFFDCALKTFKNISVYGIGKNKFLQGTAYIPSKMFSQGIWVEVIKEMNKKEISQKPDYSSYKED